MKTFNVYLELAVIARFFNSLLKLRWCSVISYVVVIDALQSLTFRWYMRNDIPYIIKKIVFSVSLVTQKLLNYYTASSILC